MWMFVTMSCACHDVFTPLKLVKVKPTITINICLTLMVCICTSFKHMHRLERKLKHLGGKWD